MVVGIKLIVAGSRTFSDYKLLAAELNKYNNIDEIVSGEARGADSMGEWYALEHKIKLKKFPAKWGIYGKSAGYVRNNKMAAYADEAIVFWDGKSSRSKHMIDTMKAIGKPVKVVEYNDGSN